MRTLITTAFVLMLSTASFAQGTNPGGWGRGQGGSNPCTSCNTSNSQWDWQSPMDRTIAAAIAWNSRNPNNTVSIRRGSNVTVVGNQRFNTRTGMRVGSGGSSPYDGWDGTYSSSCGCYR